MSASPTEPEAQEDEPAPVLAAVRQRHPSSGRSQTIPNSRKLSRKEQYQRYDDVLRDGGVKQAALTVGRPKTRRDCFKGENARRPCPWVSCANSLYLDVDPKTGALKLNFPDLDVWQMDYSCALDEADENGDGMTLEQVAERIRITRERVRQLENRIVESLTEEVTLEGGAVRKRLRVIP